MPQMGESITTGTITKWHKAPGDKIEIDEILLEISTDKVESEIPSPVAGRIDQILFPEGETVDVGVKIAVIEDDDAAELSSGGAAPATSEPKAPAPAPAEAPAPAKESASAPESDSADRRFYTPLVKKLAADNNVPLSELANVKGTGAGGRVNKADFEAYLNTRSSGGTTASSATASSKPSGGGETSVSVAAVDALAGYTGRYEVEKMDNMRKAIAKNMVASKLTSPHVNSVSEVDLSHLVEWREKHKNDFVESEGFKITYTPFILRALIMALKEFPQVNASVSGDEIVLKKDINLGCAVAVPGNGLVVPVIKNADNLNMLGLCRTLDDLANRARDKKLSMDELQGGTFTFTNVGSFGTLLATPVILQPQLGIYAAGVIQKRVMVMKNNTIGIRDMMYGTHTYDHRLIDGEQGGKFLEAVHRNLREMDPSTLF